MQKQTMQIHPFSSDFLSMTPACQDRQNARSGAAAKRHRRHRFASAAQPLQPEGKRGRGWGNHQLFRIRGFSGRTSARTGGSPSDPSRGGPITLMVIFRGNVSQCGNTRRGPCCDRATIHVTSPGIRLSFFIGEERQGRCATNLDASSLKSNPCGGPHESQHTQQVLSGTGLESPCARA